jgi:hypothetical protein
MDTTNAGLQQVITDLAQAHVALRQSSSAFDEALVALRAGQTGLEAAASGIQASIAGMRATLDAIATANPRKAPSSTPSSSRRDARLFTSSDAIDDWARRRPREAVSTNPMTVEHLTLLQPGDVRSVRVICQTCRSALSIDLAQTVQIPKDCPVCRTAWQDAPSSGSADAAMAVANAFKAWRQTEHARQPPFALWLEIVQPPGRVRREGGFQTG